MKKINQNNDPLNASQYQVIAYYIINYMEIYTVNIQKCTLTCYFG